jgi:hypothetical protein
MTDIIVKMLNSRISDLQLEIAKVIRERDEARDALATARRDARNDALEEAAQRIDKAHLECCDPERYDKGECCGDFIAAQEAIRQL